MPAVPIFSLNATETPATPDASTVSLSSLHEFLFHLPKIEVHAHLNGCIRESTLLDLARERNVALPSHLFGSIDNKSHDNHHDIRAEPHMYNTRPRSLQDCFDLFAEIPKCVNDLSSLKRITLETLQDFANHHVAYLELRSTPKRLLMKHGDKDKIMATKRDYIETILSVMREFQQQEHERYHQEVHLLASQNHYDCNDYQSLGPRLPMICHFIIAVDRSQTVQEAKENIDLACEFFVSHQSNTPPLPNVVGVDLGGNPTRGDFDRDFRILFERARSFGLRVTLHCAEISCGSDDTSNDDEWQRQAYKEAQDMLSFGPDRLGHALLLPPSLSREMTTNEIPVETCPTSNVMTLELAKRVKDYGNLIHGLQQHPGLLEWIESRHPLCICTDDPGVFETNLTKELYFLARAFDLSQQDVARLVLASTRHLFCDNDTKQLTQTRMKQRIERMIQLIEKSDQTEQFTQDNHIDLSP